VDVEERMMKRMGIDPKPRSSAQLDEMRRVAIAQRTLPDDIDFTLEAVVSRMIGLLLIEISAFHGFAWAEAVLGDRSLVAGDGAAATIVSYIRSDETPHVAWLRTALSEMRDRTWVGTSGRHHRGDEMIGLLWKRALKDSVMLRRQESLNFTIGEIEHALAGRPDGDDIMDEMLTLGSVVRRGDGTAVDREGVSLLG
jgi:hypothetical protein